MRKRIGNLISPVYKSTEINAKSLNNQANINSAYAFLNGLYAIDSGFAGLDNIQNNKAMPPFEVSSEQSKVLGTYTVQTDAGRNWALNFLLQGYNEVICPYIAEVRFYEQRESMVFRTMMDHLNTTMLKWLNDRHELINYNEDGELINELPPILYDV